MDDWNFMKIKWLGDHIEQTLQFSMFSIFRGLAYEQILTYHDLGARSSVYQLVNCVSCLSLQQQLIVFSAYLYSNSSSNSNRARDSPRWSSPMGKAARSSTRASSRWWGVGQFSRVTCPLKWPHRDPPLPPRGAICLMNWTWISCEQFFFNNIQD